MKVIVQKTSGEPIEGMKEEILKLTSIDFHTVANLSVYTTEVQSLDELLDLRNKYNCDIIITSSEFKEIPLKIELYDTWRE